MGRAKWLQETRQMRFEEAYGAWSERRLTQEEAARLLGVCDRTFRRYIDRYEDEGLAGLVDKRIEQVSHRKAPVDEVLRLEPLPGCGGDVGEVGLIQQLLQRPGQSLLAYPQSGRPGRLCRCASPI